tara:strand:+ start:291 stop:722 length:432 start_codon:yes stop_codon:yes gene_type:complete
MISQAICNSFKQGLLEGKFDFSGTTSQVFKIALYTSASDISANTVAYTTLNEVVGSGYTAGGETLTVSVNPTLSNGVAYMNFANVTWAVTSLTARGALIYKADGATNPAIATLLFGEDVTTSSGSFEVEFPLSTAQTAIVRSV